MGSLKTDFLIVLERSLLLFFVLFFLFVYFNFSFFFFYQGKVHGSAITQVPVCHLKRYSLVEKSSKI